MKNLGPLAAACIVIFTGCAGLSKSPAPAAAAPLAAAAAPDAPRAVRPGGLVLSPEPAAGKSASDILTELDSRMDRMAALFRTLGANEGESAWLSQAQRAEASEVGRALERFAHARSQPMRKGEAFQPKPARAACLHARFRLFPRYGYQGPDNPKKLPFLKDLEALVIATIATAQLQASCSGEAGDFARLAARWESLAGIRADIARFTEEAGGAGQAGPPH